MATRHLVILQTKVELPKPERRYDHRARFLCLGSCFAAEMGERLDSKLFDSLRNPLGTLFNPLAVAEVIVRSLSSHWFNEDEFFNHQELWRHFLVHSNLASPLLCESVTRANEKLESLRDSLKSSDVLIMSLGSAYVYELPNTEKVVGHNHKLPLKSFNKRLLQPSEIENRLASVLKLIKEENPNLSVVLTVSPIRHLRDGLHENNLSKASLLLAANGLQADLGFIGYFPAYEILLDELRDYRFYASDMTHPNLQAIDYIWDCFSKTYLTETSQAYCKQVEAIELSLNHRPHHTNTQSYEQFKAGLKNKILALIDQEPRASRFLDRWKSLP